MKVFWQETENALVVLRDWRGVILSRIFLAFMPVAMGLLLIFMVVSKDSTHPFLILGFLFFCMGSLILWRTPGKYKSYRSQGGKNLLRVSRDSIQIFPEIGAPPVRYHWHQIDRILVVDKLIQRNTGAFHSGTRRLLFLFDRDQLPKGIWENVKGFRSRGPQGEAFTIVPYPTDGERRQVCMRLKSIIPEGVAIDSTVCVEFDFRKRKTIIADMDEK